MRHLVNSATFANSVVVENGYSSTRRMSPSTAIR